jgi:hypothetical protein
LAAQSSRVSFTQTDVSKARSSRLQLQSRLRNWTQPASNSVRRCLLCDTVTWCKPRRMCVMWTRGRGRPSRSTCACSTW